MSIERLRGRRLRAELLEDRRMLASYTVDTILDVVNAGDGLTSLREALEAANALPGADFIDFDGSLTDATIQLQSGQSLVISDDVTIAGIGADLLTIQGNNHRVFTITDGDVDTTVPKNVTISGLKITGGAHSAGGGIFSQENLTLIDSIVTDNTANATGAALSLYNGGGGILAVPGEEAITTTIIRTTISDNLVTSVPDEGILNPVEGHQGGGIHAIGTLIIIDSQITGNRAGEGSPGHSSGAAAGAGGDGGGVYSEGSATIQGTTISGNTAGKGRNGESAVASDGGAGGDGGGIAARGSLTLTESVVSANFAGAPGRSELGFSGKGGNGGGVHFTATGGGSLSVTRSTIANNAAGNGVDGTDWAAQKSSAGGDGGGVWLEGAATFRDSTISANSSGVGGNAHFYLLPINSRDAGNGGNGGGMWISGDGAKSLVNVTVSGNVTGAGGNDVAGAKSGSGGAGGAIWIAGTGAVTIAHSTLVYNATGEAGSSVAGGLGGGTRGAGGGAFHFDTAATATLNHALVALNRRGTTGSTTPSDAEGAFTVGYSLLGVNTGATITNTGGNQIGVAASPINPLIGPLADNGGPTRTHALAFASPAVDAGNPALVEGVGGTPNRDQRGAPYHRIVSPRIDIGSFELLDIIIPIGDADFDDDQDVDGQDFLLWQRGLGDADEDGDSDGDDLDIWRDSFGTSAAVASATVSHAAALQVDDAPPTLRWNAATLTGIQTLRSAENEPAPPALPPATVAAEIRKFAAFPAAWSPTALRQSSPQDRIAAVFASVTANDSLDAAFSDLADDPLSFAHGRATHGRKL